ncbi:13700_t:CDS:2 [Funneliformis mosseae]|uniref:13700_t:CDS:1 n=1 Tax=Funneliformis mosseae TaxID=27381 RepID=A0A9N9ER66_FUNMO|nr:13700_t:CDS:2 [Funneliformis mosseae]
MDLEIISRYQRDVALENSNMKERIRQCSSDYQGSKERNSTSAPTADVFSRSGDA